MKRLIEKVNKGSKPLSDTKEYSLEYLYDLQRHDSLIQSLKHMELVRRVLMYLLFGIFLILVGFVVCYAIKFFGNGTHGREVSVTLALALFVVRVILGIEQNHNNYVKAEIEYREYISKREENSD